MSDLKVGAKRLNTATDDEIAAKQRKEDILINGISDDTTPGTSHSDADKAEDTLPDEAVYFLRIICLIIDLGTDIVLKAFLRLIEPDRVETFLKSEQNRKKLEDLRKIRVLSPKEYELVVNRQNPKPNSFDISLLIKLVNSLFLNKEHLPKEPKPELDEQKEYTSLAHDLKRLRNVRNKIVGHQPRARIPKWLFDKEWEGAEQSIIGITTQCMPAHLDDVKTRIKRYKERRFDSSDEKRHRQILEIWFKEIEECQQTVKELLQTVNEYELYFKNKSDRYDRYLKLLTDGGHLVLCGLLERELKKHDTDLKRALDKKRTILLHDMSEPRWEKLLFPESDNFDPSKWEIALLAEVLLIAFGTSLTLNENTEVKRIHTSCANYVDAAKTALDKDLFLQRWTDLVRSINCLSMVIDSEFKQKCDNLLEECSHKSEVCIDISRVQKNCPTLKSFTDVYKEQLHKLRKKLQSMQKQDMQFSTPLTLEAKVVTLGTNNEKVITAESILHTVWQEALKQAEDSTKFLSVRKEVEKILASIRGIEGVVKIEETQKCVILAMQCTSPSSLLKLLDYFEQEVFHECIDYISTELSDGFGDLFIMKANFTMESIHNIMSYAYGNKEDNKHEVYIPVTFSSPEGMKEAWSVLTSKEIQNSTKEISKSLSSKLGEKISVQIDMDGFHHLFEETDTSSSGSISSSSSTGEGISAKESTNMIINDYEEQQTKAAEEEKMELQKVNNVEEKTTHLRKKDEICEKGFSESTFSKSNMSTDSLCGYFETDDINKSPTCNTLTGGALPDETPKESSQQPNNVLKPETYSVNLQPQRNINEHVHKTQGEKVASTHTQTQISIGDRIRPFDQEVYGTVGPFVRIKETGEMCFLTVRHLFGRLERRDRFVIGTKVIHHNSKLPKEENERICGEVIAAEYNEDLDAALVKISKDHIPNRYSFNVIQEEQYHKAGFTVPKYADIHSAIDLESVSVLEIEKMKLIKFGSVTGLTQGQLYITEGEVNKETRTVLCKDPKKWIMEAVPYQNYLHVGGTDRRTFALEDDNGAAVYLLDNEGQLHCVGMLCRQMDENENSFLVGQIGVILGSLGKQIGFSLEIDKYEKMGDTIDEYDEDLFNRVLQSGLEYDRQIRVNIIGFFAQGKTTLTRRLINEPLHDIACTDGIEVYMRKSSIHGKTWAHSDTADIYDECSRRLGDVAKSNLELGNDLFVDEVFQTQLSDEERIMDKRTTENVSSSNKAETIRIKNAGKSSTHGFKENQEKKLGRLFSKHLREKDDETDSGVLMANVWDFGGQFIYYATHQIFHSRDAIYLLVFDLTKDLNMTMIDCDFPDRQEQMKNSLMFWVNSIHAFVGGKDSAGTLEPKILLVGTHKDKFDGDIEKKFADVIDLFVGTKLRGHIHDKPFAVASINEEDEGMEELRNIIYEIGMEKAKLNKKIPAKWMCLEIAMLEKIDKHIIKFEDIISLGAKCAHPITDKTEIKTFLNYHHEKGTIVFFDEDVLNRYVIIDPRFLVNAFKCIITAKWFCRWNKNTHADWKKLTQEAILEKDLLQEVWSKNDGNNFIEFQDILLLFMERHRILAEIRLMDENTGEIQSLGKYMIPSMLKRDVDRKAMTDFLQNKKMTMVLLGLELGDEVLATLFEKVTAALLGKWPPIEYNGQILVFENAGVYRIDLHYAGQIVKTDDSIELMVIDQCPSDQEDNNISSVVCDRLRRYVEMVISYEYKRNPSYGEKKPYKHYIKCNDPWHKGLGSRSVHYVEDIRDHTRVCCPDNRDHSIPVPEAIAAWFLDNRITDVEANAIRKALEEDEVIARIAQDYGDDWKEFGITIGLSYEELNHFVDQHKENSVRIYGMIEIWMKKYPKDSDDRLSRETGQYGYGDIHTAWDKLRNCLELL